jgi:uncharacterized phiE125 gp8 family phage protein
MKKEITDSLYLLIQLEEFKLILGIDERDDKLCCFCLVTATHTIEQYCKRRLALKTYRQLFTEWRDLMLFLNEYPVNKILSLSALFADAAPEIIKPCLYNVVPLEDMENIPYEIRLSPTVNEMYGIGVIKVLYRAGYSLDAIPSDLRAACLELAAWNFNCYKSRKIGVINNEKTTGNNTGFEMSMPENVKALLEPYRRKTI